mmetsp:Transcript_11448/g.31713  ORF Transcript_11448/g.31713 Transcript_11448/m.31713 type:complete len:132 (-) Transcript_11448:735-1130(-)
MRARIHEIEESPLRVAKQRMGLSSGNHVHTCVIGHRHFTTSDKYNSSRCCAGECVVPDLAIGLGHWISFRVRIQNAYVYCRLELFPLLLTLSEAVTVTASIGASVGSVTEPMVVGLVGEPPDLLALDDLDE